MKKWICIMLLMLCLSAQAEENTYYTLHEDIYYHVHARCGGREDMVPLSQQAAKEFQKYACPVCGPIKQNISAKSVVRGGTIVSRIPQSWVDDPQKTTTGVFAAPSSLTYEGSEAYALLSDYLHGQIFADFIDEYNTNGRAMTTVRVPEILWQKGELVMNQRHFGGAYYFVWRPKTVFEDSYTTYVRFFEHDLSMENGVLHDYVDREWNDHDFRVALDHVSGAKSVYEGGGSSLKISIFYEMDTPIAVITETNADKNRISGVPLAIGGRDTGLILSGYMDGTDAVYCCVLTDAELDMIQNGAEISLSRENIAEKADFAGTEYAVVQSGDFYGIINKNSEFVVDAKYEYIRRSAYDHIFILSEAVTYNKIIFDASRNHVIAILDREAYGGEDPGSGLWPEIQNEAVFTVKAGQYNRIFDMKTGKLISVLGAQGSGNLDGRFAGPVNGSPDRLVSRTEGMRLMDLQGNFYSDSYPQILPLIWNDDKGLFLIVNSGKEYEFGCDGRALAGSDWRCGLIGRNGEMMAEMKYVKAEIVSGYRVCLWDADGNARDFEIG